MLNVDEGEAEMKVLERVMVIYVALCISLALLVAVTIFAPCLLAEWLQRRAEDPNASAFGVRRGAESAMVDEPASPARAGRGGSRLKRKPGTGAGLLGM